MITKLFKEIIERLVEVERILKDENYFKSLEFHLKRVQDENECLKKRIGKTIEYLEKNYSLCARRELIEILEGKDETN